MKKFPNWTLWIGGFSVLLILGDVVMRLIGLPGGFEYQHWIIRGLAGIALIPGVFLAR